MVYNGIQFKNLKKKLFNDINMNIKCMRIKKIYEIYMKKYTFIKFLIREIFHCTFYIRIIRGKYKILCIKFDNNIIIQYNLQFYNILNASCHIILIRNRLFTIRAEIIDVTIMCILLVF